MTFHRHTNVLQVASKRTKMEEAVRKQNILVSKFRLKIGTNQHHFRNQPLSKLAHFRSWIGIVGNTAPDGIGKKKKSKKNNKNNEK